MIFVQASWRMFAIATEVTNVTIMISQSKGTYHRLRQIRKHNFDCQFEAYSNTKRGTTYGLRIRRCRMIWANVMYTNLLIIRSETLTGCASKSKAIHHRNL